MRKILVILSIIALLAGANVLFAGGEKEGNEATKASKYVIRFSHGLPPTHRVATDDLGYFKKLVEQKSGGRITVKLYPSGQLVSDREVLKAVKTGSIEGCAIYTFYVEKILPAFGVFTTPEVFNNTQETIKAIEGNCGKYLFDELKKKGYMPVGWVVWPQEIYGIECKTPVHVPSDLKNKVIRPTSPQSSLYFKKYGGAEIAFVSGAELYTALQRGTLDGSLATLQHAVYRKLSEVAPYFCILPGIAVNHEVIFINKDFYDRLPKELQDIILDAGRETQKHSYDVAKKICDETTAKAKELMKEVYYPTKADMALWNKDIDNFFKEALKDNPTALKLVQDIRNKNF